MKKLVYALMGFALLASCQSHPQAIVNGTLTDIRSDTLLIYTSAFRISDSLPPRTDTVAMQNGHFTFVPMAEMLPGFISIHELPSSKPDADGSRPAMSLRHASFAMLPDTKVFVSGSLGDFTLKGGEFYTQYNEINKLCKPFLTKIDSILDICAQLHRQGVNDETLRKAYAPTFGISSKIDEQKLNYIKQHPDTDIAVFLLSQLGPQHAEEGLAAIGKRARDGVLAPLYNNVKKNIERENARKEAEKMLQEGRPAPDFTLKAIDGQDFSLKSLRGKYVVLDFWTSWCGWCIKGIPDMKKIYEQYKGKIEFVGIDGDNTEKVWKETVRKYRLPWIQVRNEEKNNVMALYAIDGYPTKYVIDPDGKIMKRVIGEDPKFYDFIHQIMK